MSEFITIGEAANVFNTLGSTMKPAFRTIVNSTPPTVKKSGNGLAIVLGIILIGIVGYEVYLHSEKKLKEAEGN